MELRALLVQCLANSLRVHVGGISLTALDLLARGIKGVEAHPDYAAGRAQALVDSILLALCLFIESCMDMSKGHDDRSAYLFLPKKEIATAPTAAVTKTKGNRAAKPPQSPSQTDQFERSLQMHFHSFLKASVLQATVEVSNIAAGRADIVVIAGKIRIVVEVKREDDDVSFENLRANYAAQATEYSNANVGIGFLLVLDRTRTDGTAGDMETKLAVTSILKRGDSKPRTLVMATIPALRKTPSAMVLPKATA